MCFGTFPSAMNNHPTLSKSKPVSPISGVPVVRVVSNPFAMDRIKVPAFCLRNLPRQKAKKSISAAAKKPLTRHYAMAVITPSPLPKAL
jgi:hypothetical protein